MEKSAESTKVSLLEILFGSLEPLGFLLLLVLFSYLAFFKGETYETPFEEGHAYYNDAVATEAYGNMIHTAILQRKKWLIIAMPKYKGTYLEDEKTVSFLRGYIQAMRQHFPKVTFAKKPNYYFIESTSTIGPGILVTLPQS